MKIIYLQDAHVAGKNSKFRIGNYYQDIMAKFDEVLDLAIENKVDMIIDGGDLLNSEIVSNLIVDDILDKVEKCGIDYYALYGNHPLFGHAIKLSKATSLAHMFNRSKKFHHLEELEEDNYFIKGYDFFHNVEQDIIDNGFIHNKKDKFTICVCHAMVTLKPFHPSVLHVQIKDIKTNYDIVLIGHYHQPWGIKEINNTKFINIGSIGRRTKDEMNIKPSVLLIDTDNKELKIIKLKSSKPSNEVFDLEKIKTLEEFDDNIDEFIASIEDAEIESIDLIGKIMELGKKSNTDKIIIDELVNRVNKFKGG